MAHASGSGNVWSGIDINGNAKVQLGNSYHYGSSQDEKILSAILDKLRYPEMGQRGHEVPAAGAKTFEWLFDETDQEPLSVHEYHSNGSDGHSVKIYPGRACKAEQPEKRTYAERLRTWLKADDSSKMFWITGKPGSGKSTFMKFLRDHDQTDALLQEWAGENKLIVADHFFWLPGKPIQNSAEGLLRTLLHTVLADIASVETVAQFALVSSVCSKRRWSPQGSRRPWSLSELKQSLESVSTIPGLRIFLLIDGLDECCPQHSHDDFMETLLSILLLPTFKSCVSSRPWLEFATRLRCAPSLCLDRITHFDMLIVVTNRLMQAARDQTQYLDSPRHDIHTLADFVVHKAQGVFLWLELVTRALVIEIKNDRGMQRTYEIVTSLPSDLEEYFLELICQRIDRSSGNISDTASALKLASILHRSDGDDFDCTFIDFWLLSRGALTALMTFPHPDTAWLDARQIAVMLQQTRSFLEQSCKDLLIIVESPAVDHRMGVSSLDYNVQYLHRSAYDFLTNGPLKQSIEQGSPLHFREKGFLLKLRAIRAAYRLLEVEAGCLSARTAFHDAVMNQKAFMPEDCIRFLGTCESFANSHMSVSCNCLFEFHRQIPFVQPNLDGASTPYGYIRALLSTWPHTTVQGDLMLFNGSYWVDRREVSREKRFDLASVECRHLCKACINIMHDCLYRGFSPWDRQSGGNQGAIDWLQESYESLKRQTRERSRSLDDVYVHTARRPLVDATPRCELCKVSLSSQEDCGLKIDFLVSECAAYSAWAPGRIEHRKFSESIVTGNKILVNKVVAALPVDIPASLCEDAMQLPTVQDTPEFFHFVSRRQKIRAVHSLITSIRKQMSYMSFAQLQMVERRFDHDFQTIFGEWWVFLKGFAPRLRRAWVCYQCCNGCNESSNNCDIATTCLTCDGLPLFCEKCCNDPGSPHGRISRHPCFQISKLREPNSRTNCLRLRGILDAVKVLIKWYLSAAVFFGLESTIPKDMSSIQQALDMIPERFVQLQNHEEMYHRAN